SRRSSRSRRASPLSTRRRRAGAEPCPSAGRQGGAGGGADPGPLGPGAGGGAWPPGGRRHGGAPPPGAAPALGAATARGRSGGERCAAQNDAARGRRIPTHVRLRERRAVGTTVEIDLSVPELPPHGLEVGSGDARRVEPRICVEPCDTAVQVRGQVLAVPST